MKSYHFLDVETFSIFDNVEVETVINPISTQGAIDGNPDFQLPQTHIRYINSNYYKGFNKFIIHHEKIKHKQGRALGEEVIFNAFVETKDMNAYYNPELQLLLIEGNKASVNDFIKKCNHDINNSFRVARAEVNFPYLIQHTQNIWGGWISGFNDGNLKTVALYGDHVNLNENYDRFEAAGRLSSLNCSIGFEYTNYDFMITVNKTVVVMQNRTPEQDLDLLLFIRPLLYEEVESSVV